MDFYKISKDQFSLIQKYNNQEEAEEVANKFGDGYTVEYLYPYVPPTLQERLSNDLEFGSHLVYVFVEDNRIQGITTEQSESLLIKFRDILGFAQTGAITSISFYLPNIETDDVFTEERKEKYIEMITKYLNIY